MLTALAFVFFSCSKTTNCESIPSINDSYSAAETFSRILSRATYESKDLRLFIKNKALEQFDKDYDVFYPFVKDTKVAQGKTFREMLLQYTDEKTLCSIEKAIPKLTILVPDWSWLHCFSVNSWDAAEQDLAVTCVSQHGDISCYSNGDYVGAFSDNSVPNFPVLIIKSNERIIYTPPTKGGDAQYSFLDESFNNSSNTETKVEHEYTQVTLDGTPDISNFVPASETHCDADNMYHYFHGQGKTCYQRDYLYYGMTENGQEKNRLENVWEHIYKFRFKNWNTSELHDDIEKVLENGELKDKQIDFDYSCFDQPLSCERREKSVSDLRKYFYAEGNIELLFLIAIPSKDSTIFTTEKNISLSFGDVFAIDHVDLDYAHNTWFSHSKYVYTLNKFEAIKPKWYTCDIQLPRWDISKESGTITIVVSEIDENGSQDIKYTVKNIKATNFKGDGEASYSSNSFNSKIGLGYNDSETRESTIEASYKREHTRFQTFGKLELEYLHPILEEDTTRNGVTGYKVHTISNGTVEIMMLPKNF